MSSIPFQRQFDPRGCGPAALRMAYLSLGVEASQVALRERFLRPGRGGQPGAWAYLLARDALERGLHALAVQSRRPAESLLRASAADYRAILLHRLDGGGGSGHYSVLLRADAAEVVVHDPADRPGRRYGRDEFLRLWSPWWLSEASGHVLVAVARETMDEACSNCGVEVPESVLCPSCCAAVPLRPAGALGCADAGCPGCLWECCYCPWCGGWVPALSGPGPGRRAVDRFLGRRFAF